MEDGEGWKVDDGFRKKAELYLWQCIVVLVKCFMALLLLHASIDVHHLSSNFSGLVAAVFLA
jgi:hypothetical protein